MKLLKKHTVIKYLWSLLLTTMLFSCKNSEPIAKEERIPFTAIKSGNNSSSEVYKTMVINNQEELIEAWSLFFVKFNRKPPIPNIDFTSKTLVAVFLGERNNGGYSIKIKSVIKTNDKIAIVTEETKPGSSCMSTSVMVYPFQLIEIPKTNKPFAFTKTITINDCDKDF